MKWLHHLCSTMVLTGALTTSAYADTEKVQIAWISQGQSDLIKDTEGRLYSHLSHPNSGLARINKADGKPLWSIPFASYAYLDVNCIDKNRIFILVDRTLMALNPETGAILWNYQDKGTGNLWLTCLQRSNDVYLTSGDVSNTIHAIQKFSGQKTWEYATSGYSYLFNADWQNVYMNQSNAGSNSLVAINLWNGQELWTRPLVNTYASTDPMGRIYESGTGKILRLNPSNGQELWSYQSSYEYSYLEFNPQGQVFAHENKKISRLEPESGRVQWSRDLESSESANSQTILLKSGDLVIRTSYYPEQKARTNCVNGWDGTTRWETWTDSTQGYIVEDEALNIYQISGRSLIALDSNNGQVRWTYELQSDTGQNIFQLFGSGDHLYLTYGVPMRYPPMGLVRLSAANGSVYWQHFIGTTFAVVDWDSERVYTSSYHLGESAAFR